MVTPGRRRSRSSPDAHIEEWLSDLSPSDNIRSIETVSDLQTSVDTLKKPISIVLFYGRYCPYSKRVIPGFRQWARANADRIFLYEVDVEQGSGLTDFYHVRVVPTIMAFAENNLLAPVWQRTGTHVQPSDLQSTTDESSSIVNDQEEQFDQPAPFEELFRGRLTSANNIFLLLDPSSQGSKPVLKTIEASNTDQQGQYLIILDNKRAGPDEPKYIVAITSNRKHF